MDLRGMLHRLAAARIATPIVVALVLLALSMNEWTHQRTQQIRLERLALLQARVAGMEAMQLLTDAETAQRGYLLTGDAAYLAPYEVAIAALPRRLNAALDYLTAAGDEPARQALEARQLTETRLSELATTIEMYRDGRREAAVDLVKSGLGKDGMDRLRVKLIGALQGATVQDGIMEASVRNELAVRRWTINLLALVSGVAVLAYLRKLANDARTDADARNRLEAEVLARTADLRQLASNLQTVQEAERARLSRELHDELGGLLTAAKFDLVRLRNARDPAQVADRLQQANRRLDDVVAIKRRIIEDLRPSALQHLGLGKALELLRADVSERLGVPVQTRLDDVELLDDAELTVYRLVQEALTNAQKYARADRLGVVLSASPGTDELVVSIEDNGAGFDVHAARVARHGLAGMRHRVESLGGSLHLDSAPDRGTRIVATLPLKNLLAKPAGAVITG